MKEEEISKRQMDSNKIEKEKRDHPELKRLGFVRVYAIKTLVCVSNLYGYAKHNSGSLKSAVGTVENAVAAVVGPVYENFKGVPDDLLVFLDAKVDEAANKFDERAPPSAKQASKVHMVVRKASKVTRTLVQEAQAGGLCAAVHYAGALLEQLFWSVMVRFWFLINQVPLLCEVAQMAAPTMAHWSEKYNKTVEDLSAKGYTFFSVFPYIPIDGLAKAYKKIEAEKGPAYAVEEEMHKD